MVSRLFYAITRQGHIIMKRAFTYNLFTFLFTVVLLVLPTNTYSQHRIPNKGENIKFYPIVKEQRKIYKGYDCFFAENLACKDGRYYFKKKYRFKKGNDNLTPLEEIENYTFYVRNIKTVSVMNKQVMLIYLTRNEDGEKVVLRLQLESSRGNNFLSNAMFEYKKEYNGMSYVDNGPRYIYAVERINLAYINSDSLNTYKERYVQKDLVFYEKLDRSIDFSQRTSIEKDFNEIVEIVNKKKHSFKEGTSYFCMGIGFAEVFEESLNKVPCMRLRTSVGEFIDIPLCYFNKKLSREIHLLPNFFITEDVYRAKKLAIYDLQPMIDKYVGKDVYYGLDKTFTTERLKKCKTLGTNEYYKLLEGGYKCIDFIIDSEFRKHFYYSKGYEKEYPYVVLEDSMGVKFKVCIENETNNFKVNNSFETYFTHKHVADSVIAERERVKFENALRQMKRLMDLEEEFGKETGFLLFGCSDEEVDRFRGLKKEFGEKYGLYLIKRSDEDVDRFRRLKKKYGALNAIAILGKSYAIGWTEDMVRESLGIPYDINRSVGSWGVHEQWIYKMDYETIYIYFENGKVRSFQD